MDAAELKALADLVADIVVCRLSGRDAGADDRRQAALLRDLNALSETRGILPDLLPRIRQVLADHEFDRVAGEIRELGAREANPPDDLFDELRRLAEKIRRAQNEDTYEYKLPTRVQIKIPDLVSILVEILDILKKLSRRSIEAGAPAIDGSVLPGLVLMRSDDEGAPAAVLLPDTTSVALARFDDNDDAIAALAFELIGRAGNNCVKRTRLVSGGTQIRCVANPCAQGCRVLRHPRKVPADLEKVEDVTPSTPGWVTMNKNFFYWCKCGPF